MYKYKVQVLRNVVSLQLFLPAIFRRARGNNIREWKRLSPHAMLFCSVSRFVLPAQISLSKDEGQQPITSSRYVSLPPTIICLSSAICKLEVVWAMSLTQ